MESIFESLENLNVSEDCFEDIVGLVEGILKDVAAGALNTTGDKNFSGERHRRIEAFANKHPKIYGALDKIERRVDRPLSAIQGAAGKLYDKITNTVTNMKGPIGDKIRGSKIGRKIFGNRAIKNAQKGINRAKGDWGRAIADDSWEDFIGNPGTLHSTGVKNAVDKAIDTEKKWGARIHY
jgi:hypothetical protein